MCFKTVISYVYIERGYYTAARRYERAQRVSKILFLTRENKIHIFKPPCNFLFIIETNLSLAIFHRLCAPNGRERAGNDVMNILTCEDMENTPLGSRM